MKKRVEWIDIAKGIGMLLIIIGHSLGVFAGGYLMSAIYAVNVPIFFVISGYLFKEKKTTEVIKKGFKSLVIPYFIVSGIILIISYLQNRTNFVELKSMGSVITVIKAILYASGTHTHIIGTNILIPAIGAIWFLIAMYIGNILFNFTIKYATDNKIILVLIPVVETTIGFLLGKWILLPFSINAALVVQVFYLFGYILKQSSISVENNGLFLTGIIAWVISTLSGNFWVNIAHADMQFPAVVGACGASYVVMYLSRKIELSKINHSALRIFGRYSLIVMCIHLIDLNVVNISRLIFNKITIVSNDQIASISVIIYRIVLTLVIVLIINAFHNFKIKNISKSQSDGIN